ncbi:pyridoxamine 5'-phosphate oxidase family protein [soil metagenome]
MSQATDTRETLWDLIKDIRFGMFTTRHTNGLMHSRPMTAQNKSIDESATLYFFASKTGELAADIAADSSVGVSFSDTGKDSYVGIGGQARFVEDQAKKEALWTPMAAAWFPGGVKDPDLGLIEVTMTKAEYWDVKENKATQLLKMAKAAVTGKPPSMGEHKEVNLH